MRLRSVLTVLGTAAVTAALTVFLAAPWVEGVAQAAPTVVPVIAPGLLSSQGCTFTLKTDKQAYEAGASPVIEVTAVNKTGKPVDATVWVTIAATSPMSRMSRMMPRPTTLWSQEFAFSLKAEETKSLKMPCSAKLQALQDVGIVLSDKKNSVLATNVGIPANFNQSNAGGPNAAPNRNR
jgi:hypothetical protein